MEKINRPTKSLKRRKTKRSNSRLQKRKSLKMLQRRQKKEARAKSPRASQARAMKRSLRTDQDAPPKRTRWITTSTMVTPEQPQLAKSAQVSKLSSVTRTKMTRKLPQKDRRSTLATMRETRSRPLPSAKTRVGSLVRLMKLRWQRGSRSGKGKRRKRPSAGNRRRRAKKRNRPSVSSRS